MQAVKRDFAQIINGPKQFVIPVFQRDYAWGPEQCDRMWEDVPQGVGRCGGPAFPGVVRVRSGPGRRRFWELARYRRSAAVDHVYAADGCSSGPSAEVGWDGGTPSVAQIDDFFLKNNFETGGPSLPVGTAAA